MFRAYIFISKKYNGVYKLPVRLEIDAEILTNKERLMCDLNELEEYYYEIEQDIVCIVIHEIPLYWAFNKSGYIKEWVYCCGKMLSESSHCTAIEAYTDEVDSLIKFKKGDVVCVLKDNYLTMGIVISHTDGGYYDLITFIDEVYIREQIAISKVFNKPLGFVFDETIKTELQMRLSNSDLV